MDSEGTLSDKIIEEGYYLPIKDVREFIRREDDVSISSKDVPLEFEDKLDYARGIVFALKFNSEKRKKLAGDALSEVKK